MSTRHVTILVPGGKLTPGQMRTINTIAEQYGLSYYLTTAQNVRLIGATAENIDAIQSHLLNKGILLKVPGRFPKPKVCVGMPGCNLGVGDTFALSDKILARFGNRSDVRPKYKIALSGCPACCGGSKLADIGVVATRKGFDVYVGGKGGPLPRVGQRIARGLSDEQVLDVIGRLADYHAARTPKKQRMFKLLNDRDFPCPPEE